MFPVDCQAKQHNSFLHEFDVLPRVPAGRVLAVDILFNEGKKEEDITYSNDKARD